MLTLVALALFSFFCLNGLPLIAIVEQLLLPAWGSSNMTFTNETDDNPAEVKLKSQDWVDNGTRDNLFRWIYGSSEDEKLNYHNLSNIYLYVCRNNHTNYIFHHSIASRSVCIIARRGSEVVLACIFGPKFTSQQSSCSFPWWLCSWPSGSQFFPLESLIPGDLTICSRHHCLRPSRPSVFSLDQRSPCLHSEGN